MTTDPLGLIERCGRVCYKSEDKITDTSKYKFVEMLLKRGHEAVLEHASATYLLITDRGVTHELVRHRLASYCQESTRYCNYGNEITVVEPPGLSDYDAKEWRQACGIAETCYKNLLAGGQSPQIARSVLPTCLKTEITITANFREWRHIFKLRTSAAAHPQIRELIGFVKSDFINRGLEILCEST